MRLSCCPSACARNSMTEVVRHPLNRPVGSIQGDRDFRSFGEQTREFFLQFVDVPLHGNPPIRCKMNLQTTKSRAPYPNFRSWAKIAPIFRCFFVVTPYSSGRPRRKRRCSANLVSCLSSEAVHDGPWRTRWICGTRPSPRTARPLRTGGSCARCASERRCGRRPSPNSANSTPRDASRCAIWPTRSSVWSVNPPSLTRTSRPSPSLSSRVVSGWNAVGGSATSGSPGNSGRRSDSIRGWRNVCPEAAKMCRGA